MAEFMKGGIIVNNASAAAATVTATLTAPAAGQVNKILWILCYSVAATVADVAIQRNDGTELGRLGGAGIGILGQPLIFGATDWARNGFPDDTNADAAKVVLTTTGGTTCKLAVGYVQVPT